jgi:hypothetical protein
MPKIPTFQTQARPTAEVGAIKSNLQIDPTKTMAAGLSAIAGVAQDYYIKQRDNVEKLEAKKKFYEMKAEENRVVEKLKNNADEFGVVDIYNNEFGFYKDSTIKGIENKRVRDKVQQLFDLDQPETIYKLQKNAFSKYESQENEMYATEQTIKASEYSLETDKDLKAQKKRQRIDIAKEYESKMVMGKEWLSKELKKIETDSVMFDADKAMANKDYGSALNILKTADKSKVDSEQLQKKLLQIDQQIKINEDKTLSAIGKSIIANSKFTEGADTSALLTDSIRSKYTNLETQNKVIDAIKKEQEERSTTITKKGSAEYYLSKNSALAEKYAVAIQDPTQFETYKEEADKIYAEKNVPLQYRTYLPYDKVKEIGDVIKENKNPKETLNYIDRLNATYGSDAMPGLFKQLTKDGLTTDLQIVMSTNSDSLKRDILSAASNKDLTQKAKTTLKDIELKTMKTDISNKTKEYQNIVRSQKLGNVDKTEYLLSLETTLYNAALNKVVAQGMSTSKAVEEVTSAFKADYDTTQRTYFIPKDVNGVPVVIPDVKDKADALLLSVEKSDYLERFHGKDGFAHYATLAGFQNALPDNIKMSTPEVFNSYVEKTMVNAMKKDSKWLLNSDSTGIILYVDLTNGLMPIINAKGEKIEFLFTTPTSRTKGGFIDFFFDEKMKKLKGTEFIEPGTGLPMTLFNKQDFRETNYNIE